MSSISDNTRKPILSFAIAAFVVISILVVSFPNALAANVTLAWDANTESDLAGYKLYYGTATRNYPNNIDVGNVTTHTVPNLVDGQTYYFAVTAYDNQRNESAYSDEVTYTDSTGADSDGDGISDQDEINLYGTNPNAADTDQDGLNDGDEITVHGTNPNTADTDSDGLSDAAEINIHGTNPRLSDSDQDGLSDAAEIITYATNPNSAVNRRQLSVHHWPTLVSGPAKSRGLRRPRGAVALAGTARRSGSIPRLRSSALMLSRSSAEKLARSTVAQTIRSGVEREAKYAWRSVLAAFIGLFDPSVVRDPPR